MFYLFIMQAFRSPPIACKVVRRKGLPHIWSFSIAHQYFSRNTNLSFLPEKRFRNKPSKVCCSLFYIFIYPLPDGFQRKQVERSTNLYTDRVTFSPYPASDMLCSSLFVRHSFR